MPELSLDQAMRLVEIGLAFALIQRGLEHLERPEQWLFAAQIGMAGLLGLGLARELAIWVLWGCVIWQLHMFRGPYNGGADKMVVLVLTCLGLAHLAEGTIWAELALAYLAVQVVLSYFISGWVKLCNADWRQGAALRDVLAWSIYPVSEAMRGLGQRHGLVRAGSWGVIAFEVAFPLALVSPVALVLALFVAGGFHLANTVLFGLNRFFWIWISTYPILFWFQGRVLG